MKFIELTNIDTNDTIHVNPEHITAMFYEDGLPGLALFFTSGFNIAVKESTVEVLAKINGDSNESK